MLANTTRHCKSSFDLFGLPADIACLAISYLSPHDLLCAFSQVSRAAHSLAYCPAAWHEVHITRPPPAPSAPLTQSRSGTGSASGSGPAPGAGAAARRSGVGDACSHVSLDDAALHTLLVRRGSWSRLRVLHLDASSALTDAAAESIELFAAGAVGVGCEWERPRSDSGASTAESGDQESHSKALLRFSTPIGEATSADSDGASDVGDTICGDISGGGGMLPLLNDLSLASCQWLRARSTLCALVNAAPGLTALDIRYAFACKFSKLDAAIEAELSISHHGISRIYYFAFFSSPQQCARDRHGRAGARRVLPRARASARAQPRAADARRGRAARRRAAAAMRTRVSQCDTALRDRARYACVSETRGIRAFIARFRPRGGI